jgi:hypothetical protein
MRTLTAGTILRGLRRPDMRDAPDAVAPAPTFRAS